MLTKIRGAAALALAVAAALTVGTAGTANAASAAAAAQAGGSYIYGYVFAPHGTAAGVTVKVSTCVPDSCDDSGQVVGSDVTTSTGAYHVDVPGPGWYMIRVITNNPAWAPCEMPWAVDGGPSERYLQILHVGPQPTSPPKMVNAVRVGNHVSGDVGTWPKHTVNDKVIWLLDGKPIAGQTDGDWFYYLPTPADLGHKLSFQVSGKWAYSTTTTVTSKPVVVERAYMFASAKAPATVRARHPLPVTGHVYGSYGHVTGTVSLREGATVVATAPVGRFGRYTLTVRPTRGSHIYRVRYSGDRLHRPATSRKLSVTATR